MTDKPIIFSAPMIRALLDRRKTMTRRLADQQPEAPDNVIMPLEWWTSWRPGDVAWVRENWRTNREFDRVRPRDLPSSADFWFDADTAPTYAGKLRPSIYLPRRASRLTLIVEGVKIQQLQDISEEDAIAEGCVIGKVTGHAWRDHAEMRLGGDEWASARDWYADLWKIFTAPTHGKQTLGSQQFALRSSRPISMR